MENVESRATKMAKVAGYTKFGLLTGLMEAVTRDKDGELAITEPEDSMLALLAWWMLGKAKIEARQQKRPTTEIWDRMMIRVEREADAVGMTE